MRVARSWRVLDGLLGSLDREGVPPIACPLETKQRRTLMKPIARLERKSLVTALVLAGAVSLAGAAFAQYPQDRSKPTVTPPASSSVTPPLANDPAGAKADKPAGSKGSSEPSTKELMSAKPMIPSKAEMPDAAFKKLDATGKGYVTTQDTKELNGFDKAFQVADANHDGKLDAAEFKRAWASYTGRKSG
jgi:hypothetical protein